MLKPMQRIHRVAGLVSIAIIVMLVITGVLINQSERLELYDRYVTSAPVLWLYGGPATGEGDLEALGYAEPPSWQMVLTAFHGGRFFSWKGNVYTVTASFILLLLIVTGPYLWLKRRAILRSNKKPVEEVVIEKSEQIEEIKTQAGALHTRADRLHKISEHVLDHVKGRAHDAEIDEIEGHMKELDLMMHGLIYRIEKLERGTGA